MTFPNGRQKDLGSAPSVRAPFSGGHQHLDRSLLEQAQQGIAGWRRLLHDAV
jgi:hypothetical protein